MQIERVLECATRSRGNTQWVVRTLALALLGMGCVWTAPAEARNHATRGVGDNAITRVGIVVASEEVVRFGIGGSWRLTVSDAPVVLDFDALFEVPALVATGDGDGYHFGGGITARFRPIDRLVVDAVLHPGVAVRDRDGLQAIAPHVDVGVRVLVPAGSWTLGAIAQLRQPLFTKVNVDPREALRDNENGEETEPEDVPPIGLGGGALRGKAEDDEEPVAGERTMGGPGSARAGLLVLREQGASAYSLAGGVELALPLMGEIPALRPHRPTDVWLHLAWQFRW